MDKRQKGTKPSLLSCKSSGKRQNSSRGAPQPDDRQGAGLSGGSRDLTQDELALIAEYVKRDLGNYDEGRKDEQVEESAFMLALKDTAWSWLADVTDRTQVEWQELADELEHKGSTGLATGWGSGYWCAITASGAIPCYILSSSAPVPSAGPMSITVSHSLPKQSDSTKP